MGLLAASQNLRGCPQDKLLIFQLISVHRVLCMRYSLPRQCQEHNASRTPQQTACYKLFAVHDLVLDLRRCNSQGGGR